jgi:hypothetical protein
MDAARLNPGDCSTLMAPRPLQTVLAASGSQSYSYGGFGGGHPHFHPGKVGCVASRVTRDGGCLLTDQRAMVMPGAAAPTAEPEEWRDCSATTYCAV